MVVFLLKHYSFDKNTLPDEKMLGIFSDLTEVHNAVQTYRMVEGFRDFPDNFVISRTEIPHIPDDHILFQAIFYAHDEGYEIEIIKELGVSVSREEAMKTMDVFLNDNQSFTKNHLLVVEPIIDHYELNERNWKKGFSPVDS